MKTKLLALLIALAGLTADAVEIVRRTTLSDGGVLYASDLHNLVDTATIGSGFYNDQQTVAALSSGNFFLILDASTGLYRRVTAQTVLYGNTGLFTGQTVTTTAPWYDSLLMYDPTNNAYRTILSSNLFYSASPFLNVPSFVFWTTNGYTLPAWSGSFGANAVNPPSLLVLGTNNSAAQWQPLSNALSSFAYDLGTNYSIPFTFRQLFNPFGLYGTNASTNLWGVFTNFAVTSLVQTVVGTNTTLSNTDFVPIYSQLQGTNTTATLLALAQFISNSLPRFPVGWTSYEYTVTSAGAANSIMVTNHGLPGRPQFLSGVLVCKTAEFEFSIGDEIPLENMGANNGVPIGFGASSTNAWLNSRFALQVFDKTNGTIRTLTAGSWKAKLKAMYWPSFP